MLNKKCCVLGESSPLVGQLRGEHFYKYEMREDEMQILKNMMRFLLQMLSILKKHMMRLRKKLKRNVCSPLIYCIFQRCIIYFSFDKIVQMKNKRQNGGSSILFKSEPIMQTLKQKTVGITQKSLIFGLNQHRNYYEL